MDNRSTKMQQFLGKLVANCYDKRLHVVDEILGLATTIETESEKVSRLYFSKFEEREAKKREIMCSLEGFLYDLFEIFDPELVTDNVEDGLKFRIIMEDSSGLQVNLDEAVFDVRFQVSDWIEEHSEHGSELRRLMTFMSEEENSH